MRTLLLTLASATIVLAFATAASTATPDVPLCEPAGSYECELDGFGETVVDPPPELIEDRILAQPTCWRRRTVHGARQYKTWFGLRLMYQYVQQVTWCFNGTRVTSIRRLRAPRNVRWPWVFDGHVSSNCSEFCGELAGGSGAQIWTIGHFHGCTFQGPILCSHKYPAYQININAAGNWSRSGWDQ